MKNSMLSLSHFGKNYSTTMPNFKSWQKSLSFIFLLLVSFTGYPQTQQASEKTATWTGAVSSDWCNTGNWQGNTMPDETTNTVIPAKAKNMPVVTCDFSFNAYTGSINVETGATLTIPANKTLNIYGEFLNKDESRYVLSGRVNFAGKDQEIPGFTYNSVSINGGGMETLSSNALVNGILVMTKGIVKTGDNKSLTLGYRSMVSAGYGTAYVDGPLTRLTNSTHVYTFPVGQDGLVSPVSVSPNDETPGSYTVTYHHAGIPDNGNFSCPNLMANKTDEFWDVKRATGSAAAYVQLNYKTPSDENLWSNRKQPLEGTNVAVIVNTSGSWKFTADASKGLENIESAPFEYDAQIGGAFEADAAKMSIGYGYSFIDPVKFIAFGASLQGNSSIVKWNIEQGADMVTTDLEHSTDNKHFDKLGSAICGRGFPATFNHNNLSSGVHYYRVLVTDKARNTSYSKIIELVVPDYFTKIIGLKATQVRFDGYLLVKSATSQQVAYTLFDMAGHQVSKQSAGLQAGDNSLRFNTMMITPGIYNLYVQTADGARATLRFIKD
jgi:hypothetical protein